MQRFNVSSYSWVSPYNEVLLWGYATYFQAHHGSTFLHIDKHNSKHLLVVSCLSYNENDMLLYTGS